MVRYLIFAFGLRRVVGFSGLGGEEGLTPGEEGICSLTYYLQCSYTLLA
jgi:hypothetical protein